MRKITVLFLALLLIFNLCILSTSAAESPIAINYYAMHVAIDGHGHAEVDKVSIPTESDELVTFTALPGEGYHFVGWKIEGAYNIVEGNIYSPTIKLCPTSDIFATAIFNDADGTVATMDTSPISPKTGQNSLPVFLALVALVLSAGSIMMINTKKIKR